MKKLFNFFLSGKPIPTALWYLAVTFLVTGLISCIALPVGMNYMVTFQSVFLLFGAPGVVSAVLSILQLVPGEESPYGMGLYYGTIAVCAFIRWLYPEIQDEPLLLIGAVIACLAAYIFYLKHKAD